MEESIYGWKEDPHVDRLFLTGRSSLNLSGQVSPILVGVKDGEEHFVVIIPSLGDEGERKLRFGAALVLALTSGATVLYELRDTFFLRKTPEQVEEEGEDFLPPSLNPEADNALMVIRTKVGEDQEGEEPVVNIYTQTYSIGDQGELGFQPIQVSKGGWTGGVYGELTKTCIMEWKKNGRTVFEVEEIEKARVAMGFMGRVGGDT